METTYARIEDISPEDIALAYMDGQRRGAYTSAIRMDEMGAISLEIGHRPLWIDDGVTEAEYYRRTLTWTVPPTVDAEELDRVLADESSHLRRTLEVVHQGHEVDEDGHGYLTGAAQEASDAVVAWLVEEAGTLGMEVWDALDWVTREGEESPLAVLRDAELDPQTATTEQLAAIIRDWADHEVYLYEVDEAAEELVRRAREEAEEEAEDDA